MNPSATALAGVGFGQRPGTVTHVALSDIQSGKIKLREYSKEESSANNFKGFKKST